jgi:hypothetical protein
MPLGAAFPSWLSMFFRRLPLDEQETSYLAASASIVSFSKISITTTLLRDLMERS